MKFSVKMPPVVARVLVALVVVGGLYALLSPEEPDRQKPPVFGQGALAIQRQDGQTETYAVEIARTPPQHAYGLMFRESVPERGGMIFLYDTEEQVAMWMKNTSIPLDMVFVRSDGVIVKLLQAAKPFDTTPLPSGEPVKAVIELKDGAIRRDGLSLGDRVVWEGLDIKP